MNEIELIPAGARAQLGEGPPLQILLVDDDRVDRKIVRRLLTRSSARFLVREVESAAAAFETIQRECPDCILLDMHLPSSSGIELVRELNGFFGGFSPPVIMVTGDDSQEVGVDSMKIGVADFVAKADLEDIDLATKVRDVIALENHRRSAFTFRLQSFTRLVSQLAHEVNNSAAIGRLTLSAVLEDLPDEETESDDGKGEAARNRKLVASADEAFARIARVIKDLESETGTSLGHVGRTTLNQVVESAKLRMTKLERSGVAIDFDLASHSPLVGDAAQLTRVVADLVQNAIEAAHPAGQVKVVTFEERGYALLAVEDNGPGVPEDDKNIIFDPLFTTRADDGKVGMGLARALAITSRHGGTISVERSELGGARLLLRLPLSQSMPAPPPRSHRRSPSSETARVLVIDDEDMLRAQFYRVLCQKYDVSLARSADEARDLITETEFDIIISDVSMPGEDGVTFVRKLMKTDPGQARRVVFCSGGIVDGATAAFVQRWEKGCIPKPSSAGQLLGHIESFLEGES